MPVSQNEVAKDFKEVRPGMYQDESRDFTRSDAPQIPNLIAETAEKTKVFIINVGPKSWIQEMGGRGKFYIPACPDGEVHSLPVPILGLFPETVPVDQKKLEVRYEDGYTVALDIIGIGNNRGTANSLLPWGVFVSRTAKPSKEDLERANNLLDEKAARLVQEADDFYNAGPAEYKNITGDHRWALNRTHQMRQWAQPLVKMDVCEGCGEPIKPTIAVHSCGAVIDWDKAIALGIKKESDRPVKKSAA